jgi:hypothetical protein
MQKNQSPPHFLARAEGIAKGKTLRNRVPRSSHEEWKSTPDRPEPIGLHEKIN